MSRPRVRQREAKASGHVERTVLGRSVDHPRWRDDGWLPVHANSSVISSIRLVPRGEEPLREPDVDHVGLAFLGRQPRERESLQLMAIVHHARRGTSLRRQDSALVVDLRLQWPPGYRWSVRITDADLAQRLGEPGPWLGAMDEEATAHFHFQPRSPLPYARNDLLDSQPRLSDAIVHVRAVTRSHGDVTLLQKVGGTLGPAFA